MKKHLTSSLTLTGIGLALFILMTARQIMAGQAAVSAHSVDSPSALLDVNAALGTGFTYQGVLKNSAGNPLNSTCDFTFRLWDAESGGVMFGADSLATGVSVINGYFTASVNAGGEFGGSAFVGQARWLEVSVQCTGDPAITNLSPRQTLTATPYALYAQTVGAHSHWGASWSGSGTGLSLSGGQIGLAGGGSTAGVYGESDVTTGIGVYGRALMTGTMGIATSTSGTAGYFTNTSGSGAWGRGWGVRAITGSGTLADTHPASAFYPAAGEFVGPNGVIGAASGDADFGHGVIGVSPSENGRGVYGFTTATTGYSIGVYGRSDSVDGWGVYGLAIARTGANYGVYGRSDSPDGRGVFGYTIATTGTTYGVYGESDSTAGTGVYGYAGATTGYTYGVYSRSDSDNGKGLASTERLK
jgi:hypothetical protein